MTYCEDYPCCGHTDGLGCNYVAPNYFDVSHAFCDHEMGDCEVEDAHEYDYSDTDEKGVPWCYGCDGYAVCGDHHPAIGQSDDPSPYYVDTRNKHNV